MSVQNVNWDYDSEEDYVGNEDGAANPGSKVKRARRRRGLSIIPALKDPVVGKPIPHWVLKTSDDIEKEYSLKSRKLTEGVKWPWQEELAEAAVVSEIRCPYNEKHVIPNDKQRVCKHLGKCRENYEKLMDANRKILRKQQCQYNRCHEVYGPELIHHELECPDRKFVWAYELMFEPYFFHALGKKFPVEYNYMITPPDDEEMKNLYDGCYIDQFIGSAHPKPLPKSLKEYEASEGKEVDDTDLLQEFPYLSRFGPGYEEHQRRNDELSKMTKDLIKSGVSPTDAIALAEESLSANETMRSLEALTVNQTDNASSTCSGLSRPPSPPSKLVCPRQVIKIRTESRYCPNPPEEPEKNVQRRGMGRIRERLCYLSNISSDESVFSYGGSSSNISVCSSMPGSVVEDSYSNWETASSVPSMNELPIEEEEDWIKEANEGDHPAFDYMQHQHNLKRPLLRFPPGLTKKDRKKFIEFNTVKMNEWNAAEEKRKAQAEAQQAEDTKADCLFGDSEDEGDKKEKNPQSGDDESSMGASGGRSDESSMGASGGRHDESSIGAQSIH